MTSLPSDVRCVDLFCGVGGLTHGLIRGGIRVAAGFDIDEQCRFAYEANNDSVFLRRDVRSLTAQDLVPHFRSASIRLLAGCAPCQSFSTYSRIGRSERSDNLWPLLKEFGRLVRDVEPDLVTMENVPQLLNHSVFEDFLLDLAGYNLTHEIVECALYGVPQTRRRLVLLASRFGPIRLLRPDEWNAPQGTVREAIATYPRLEAGESDPHDSLHAACRLSDINLRRIRASKPGGTWRDWDRSLLAPCHRRETGATFPSVYGRMSWDEPSPTITTQCFGYGNGRFGHPEQDRAITLREAATLQTFPSDYTFLGPKDRVRYQVLGRLIGNAVPVKIGELIARSVHSHVATQSPKQPSTASRRRRSSSKRGALPLDGSRRKKGHVA